jgi:hypothetical protein
VGCGRCRWMDGWVERRAKGACFFGTGWYIVPLFG